MSRIANIGTAAGLAALVVIGFWAGRGCEGRHEAEGRTAAPGAAEPAPAAFDWTCSMHPQIRQPKAGRCPLCGMDLIPAGNGGQPAGTEGPRSLMLSPAARSLAEVAAAPVERRAVTVETRLVGKVRFDETRVAYIAPRVPGRIDRLYADYAGMTVKAGDHLADMYSPEMISAQQELLQAAKAADGAGSLSPLLEATRERLRLWGLTPEQIREIESSGRVRDHITFYAPIGGVVVEKDAREGQYVETGMRLFTVADLSRVWVLLEAYESDLAWLRYAQEVEFQVEAFPGETSKGVIAFIDPLLNPLTRTVQVRVNVSNADGRLKPEMFVRAVVRSPVTAGGKVAAADLSGKWLCPMHPEVVKEAAGPCDLCGMPVEKAESLGYAGGAEPNSLPLVIPETAPLLTGKRAVVYVSDPAREGLYEGREVELGPRAGAFYVVKSGLQEGERVVVNGAFKIDSSLQIQGKASMMAPEAGAAPAGPAQEPAGGAAAPARVEAPAAFKQQFDAVVEGALTAGSALADDSMDGAKAGIRQSSEALAKVDMSLLKGDAHVRWMTELKALEESLKAMGAADTLDGLRIGFAAFSKALIGGVRSYGPVRKDPLYVIRCPMAFDNQGADWLQRDPAVRNVYFGKAMLTCGEVVEIFAAPGGKAGHE